MPVLQGTFVPVILIDDGLFYLKGVCFFVFTRCVMGYDSFFVDKTNGHFFFLFGSSILQFLSLHIQKQKFEILAI